MSDLQFTNISTFLSMPATHTNAPLRLAHRIVVPTELKTTNIKQ